MSIISETNCDSWEGQKYVQCPDSLECIRFINESQIEKECLKHRKNQVNDANASFSNKQLRNSTAIRGLSEVLDLIPFFDLKRFE